MKVYVRFGLDNLKSAEAPAAATRGCRGLKENASCDPILLRNLFSIMKDVKASVNKKCKLWSYSTVQLLSYYESR